MMAMMGVKMSNDLYAKWRVHCQELGVQPSTAVRRSIEQQLSGELEKSKETDAIKTREPRADQKKVRVSMWVTESEREGIRLRTGLHGGTRAAWIINLIRAALTREPQLGADEIDALNQSNYQLLSIGRNLNQIARRLNEGQKQQSVELAMVDSLRDQIDLHTSHVEQLIRSNKERWIVQ